MINANEARIVTNENEYKEILRKEEAARLAAKRAAEQEERIKEMLMNILKPIGEAIAQQAAEGYSTMQIHIYNNNYTDKKYNTYNIDVSTCDYCRHRYIYVIDYVSELTNTVVDCLKMLGYRVSVKETNDRYKSTRDITITW